MQSGWSGLRWPGATVVVLASGPSMTPEQCAVVQAWRQCAGAAENGRSSEERQAMQEQRRVIAINTTFQLAPWADVIYGCDAPWWEMHYAQARSVCTGQFWTQDRGALHHIGMHWIESSRGNGLSHRPGIVHQGMNSGYQAIGLAHQAGAKKIVLLGFDMQGGHWHGKHPAPLTNTPAYLFALWLINFGGLAVDLEAAGLVTVNCTPGSALKCFPRMRLEDVLS